LIEIKIKNGNLIPDYFVLESAAIFWLVQFAFKYPDATPAAEVHAIFCSNGTNFDGGVCGKVFWCATFKVLARYEAPLVPPRQPVRSTNVAAARG